jgi:hypothetical protein
MKNTWNFLSVATRANHIDKTVVGASADGMTRKEVDELHAWLKSTHAKQINCNTPFSGIDSEFSLEINIERLQILTYDPASRTEELSNQLPDRYRVKIKLCGPVGPAFERRYG